MNTQLTFYIGVFNGYAGPIFDDLQSAIDFNIINNKFHFYKIDPLNKLIQFKPKIFERELQNNQTHHLGIYPITRVI